MFHASIINNGLITELIASGATELHKSWVSELYILFWARKLFIVSISFIIIF